MKKIVCLIAICVLLLAGCSSESQDQEHEQDREQEQSQEQNQIQSQGVFTPSIPEGSRPAYRAKYIPLPTDIGEITGLACHGDKAYFVATANVGGGDGNVFLSSEASIYSINLDGTGLAKLPGYEPPHIQPDGMGGIFQIHAMTVDGEGSIWTVESWGIYDTQLSANFDTYIDNPWGNIEYIETGSALRKLDHEGAELESIDLYDATGIDFISLYNVKIAVCEHIYLGGASWETGNVIYALDTAGDILFEQRLSDWDAEFVLMPDETVAIATGAEELLPIDISLGEFGEAMEVPDGLVVAKFLDLSESRIDIYSIRNIAPLPDGRIVCLTKINTGVGQKSEAELVVLQKTSPSDILSETDGKTVISLAGINISGEIVAAADRYNSLSDNYHIEVTDYALYFDTSTSAALDRLNLDITTGNLPDILYADWIPFADYASKGLFTDLNPFIDADPGIDRSDLFSAPLKAAETDGRLYRVFSGFSIVTIIGSPSTLGAGMGWSLDEFEAVMNANPGADMPFGEDYNPLNFFINAIIAAINEYIDWETGTCSFDSPEFLHLLESARKIPGSNATSALFSYDSSQDHVYVRDGRMLMKLKPVGHIVNLRDYRSRVFGEDIVFKGLPNRERNGHMLYNTDNPLAILDTSPQKEAAWDFVRTVLDKDWQLRRSRGAEIAPGSFLLNRAAFEEGAKEFIKEADYFADAQTPAYLLLTQEDIDMAIELINSVSALWNYGDALINIIREDASDYFSGATSAEETARILQDRVSIYLAERR